MGFLIVEIGLVLKGVGLDVAGVERGVGHDIIRELDELDIKPALRRDQLHGLEDLRKRTRRGQCYRSSQGTS